MIELWLPYPPSANAMTTGARNGRRRASDQYLRWQNDATAAAIQQGLHRLSMIRGAYKLTIDATRPDKRKRDIDNLIKPVSDQLQRFTLIDDDSDAQEVTARWVKGEPGIILTLEAT